MLRPLPPGIWVEQDVLRSRMRKRWESYFQSLPKAAVTWDRRAVRTAKPPDKPPPKPKPRARPRPQVKGQGEKAEEEVVFVTPPLTPPPPQPDFVQVDPGFQRDDEFWQFFDQPVPK